MAKIVAMGAGIGGISQVDALRKALGREHEVVLIGDSDRFGFTPSNPWVAVGWRTNEQITVELPALMDKHGIAFNGCGVKRAHPGDNQVELGDGSMLSCDDLVIATGPKLAFDEIEGPGPAGHTQRSGPPGSGPVTKKPS